MRSHRTRFISTALRRLIDTVISKCYDKKGCRAIAVAQSLFQLSRKNEEINYANQNYKLCRKLRMEYA